MNWLKTLLLCSALLLLGAGVTAWIFFTQPTATRTGATRETAMLVSVTRPERGTFRPTIVALGTVEPARDVILRPRVDGEVVARAAAFTPGERVRGGEVLLRLDPADFENALRQRRSELQQAEADLAIEMGRQKVAEQDYRLLDRVLPPEQEALVLREPQLSTARAQVEAARTAVEQAQLELEHTTIRAPFDAHVLTREVDVGSQVHRGDALGHLVGTESYWVVATVPLPKLRWIAFADPEGTGGAPVRVRDDAAWPEGIYREGRVLNLVGALEAQTRLARVLVEVPDPLAPHPDLPGLPALMLGSFVEVEIRGGEIPDVVRLERDALRPGDTVWLMQDGKLAIQPVKIAFQDAEYAYISESLEEGEAVVTTNLTTVTEGVRLRLQEDGGGSENTGTPEGSDPEVSQ